MKIVDEKHDNYLIVRLNGKLDASSAPDLEKRLETLLNTGAKNFLLDFEELDYVSSVGLRVLLVLAKKCKASAGQVVLCSLQEHVYEVFEISGFTAIFKICSSREEGMKAFTP